MSPLRCVKIYQVVYGLLYQNCWPRAYFSFIFVKTPSGKKLDIKTISSNYHIEVNPSDAGIYDRCVVMELVKNAAQTHQLDPTGQRDFKGENLTVSLSMIFWNSCVAYFVLFSFSCCPD